MFLPLGVWIIKRSGEIRLCETPATYFNGKVPIPTASGKFGREL